MIQAPAYAEMSKTALIDIIETQQKVIADLRWHDEIMSNTDLPIAARFAARAVRKFTQTRKPCDDGYYKGYLPAMAELAGVSPSTISRGIETLSDATEALDKYTDELRDEHGHVEKHLLYFRTHESFDEAAEIIPIKEVAKHGGNRRLPCPDCGCVHRRVKRREECAACGHTFFENERIIRGDEESFQDATTMESEESSNEAESFQDATVEPEAPFIAPLQLATLTCSQSPLASPPDILPELKSRRIWACWRYELEEGKEKPTKVPYIANLSGTRRASNTDASTWRTYDYAVKCYEVSQSTQMPGLQPFDGIGFMCDGTFTFMDQDHCRNPETGEITQEAMERARAINSYTEPSVSGDGIHTYAWGNLPAGRRRDSARGIELYDCARFCVFTGQPLPDFPQTMEKSGEQLSALHSQLFPQRPGPDIGPLWNDDTPCSLPEEEILEKARSARNGKKFQKLWSGDASDYPRADGSPDHSSADLALCCMLAHWCDKSVSTIDSLFRKSGLYRPKWERADYREKTLKLALSR